MWMTVIWTLVFSIASALSIAMLGDARLISGDLFQARRIVRLALSWQFIVAMVFALISRVTFVFINNSLLAYDQFRANATTITALITAFSYVFILAANYLFWKQSLSVVQGFGALLILLGVFLVTLK